MSEDPNKVLIYFLRELAESIESNTIESYELKKIGEFYLSWQFHKQTIEDSENQEIENFSSDQLIKFLTLGWYVYTILLKDEKLPTIDDDLD